MDGNGEEPKRKSMLQGIPKGESILAAVSRVESLEAVSLYALSLAKRTSMDASFLLVVEEDGPDAPPFALDREEIFHSLLQAGEAEGVAVRCGIVRGSFAEEVAKRLCTMGSPILVVGEGESRRSRLRELTRIEKILKKDKTWSRRNNHHFLVVSRRRDTKRCDTGGRT